MIISNFRSSSYITVKFNDKIICFYITYKIKEVMNGIFLTFFNVHDFRFALNKTHEAALSDIKKML